MMAKGSRREGTVSSRRSGKVAGDRHLQIVYRIDALLHTMRAIERQEEQLCTIMHEIKRAGVVNTIMHDELIDLLEGLASHSYQVDLDAIWGALNDANPKIETTAAADPPRRKRSKSAAEKSKGKLRRPVART